MNGAPPVFVVEIPFDGAAQSVRKPGLGAKAQLARELVRAGRISAIMAWPVLDERDQFARAPAAGRWTTWKTAGERLVSGEAMIDRLAEQTDQIDIRQFGAAADIIGFAQTPALEHERNSGAVVLHEQPVAAVFLRRSR